jgi:hypothetical protein
MTPISQTGCCAMLGIDPKTLRNWLRHANMQFMVHPADARLKCLTHEQVQQLATLHARPLQMPPAASPAFPEAAPASTSREEPTLAQPENEAHLVAVTASCDKEAELHKAMCGLEAKLMTLQEQVSQLTLQLLHEHTERYEQRLRVLEALLPQNAGRLPPVHSSGAVVGSETPSGMPERPLHPAEMRARSRVLARVEYGAEDRYVLICPREGVLSFMPDSSEWFDWLASLSAFRFIGPQNRFTAYREGLSRSWKAHRTFHSRHYKRSLGTTDRLTLARLEQIAAALQSDMAAF